MSLQIISHCEHFQLSLSIFSAMHICIDVCCFFSIHFVLLCCGLLLRMEWYSVGLICVHIISRRETTGRIRSSVTAAGAALLQLLCTLRHLNDNLLTSLQNCSLYTCDITATRRERHVQNSKGRELNITSPMSTCCTSHITSK